MDAACRSSRRASLAAGIAFDDYSDALHLAAFRAVFVAWVVQRDRLRLSEISSAATGAALAAGAAIDATEIPVALYATGAAYAVAFPAFRPETVPSRKSQWRRPEPRPRMAAMRSGRK